MCTFKLDVCGGKYLYEVSNAETHGNTYVCEKIPKTKYENKKILIQYKMRKYCGQDDVLCQKTWTGGQQKIFRNIVNEYLCETRKDTYLFTFYSTPNENNCTKKRVKQNNAKIVLNRLRKTHCSWNKSSNVKDTRGPSPMPQEYPPSIGHVAQYLWCKVATTHGKRHRWAVNYIVKTLTS
jgi:hypothetical protein